MTMVTRTPCRKGPPSSKAKLINGVEFAKRGSTGHHRSYTSQQRAEAGWVMVMKQILAAVPVALVVLAAPAHADQAAFLRDLASEGSFGQFPQDALQHMGMTVCGVLANLQKYVNTPGWVAALNDAETIAGMPRGEPAGRGPVRRHRRPRPMLFQRTRIPQCIGIRVQQRRLCAERYA
jgi:hypothetical protein